MNTLALSTDYVMRTGAFDPADAKIVHDEVTDSCELLRFNVGIILIIVLSSMLLKHCFFFFFFFFL